MKRLNKIYLSDHLRDGRNRWRYTFKIFTALPRISGSFELAFKRYREWDDATASMGLHPRSNFAKPLVLLGNKICFANVNEVDHRLGRDQR